MRSARKLLTEPQYRLLKRLDEAEAGDDGDCRLGCARDRAMAERLRSLGCAAETQPHLPALDGRGAWWAITDHGRNILDLHRQFFDTEGERG